jgi:peptidoglycan-N-acetylglucosamine deacetylase
VAERRHVTFTMHPEVVGRGYRLAALARLITLMRERASIWFVRHDELANILNYE